jgi:hypothetical protein
MSTTNKLLTTQHQDPHSGKEWMQVHNKTCTVCTHLHYSRCKTLSIETTENWYSHIPKSVCENEYIRVLWNQWVQTDREVLANRQVIIIENKKDKICLLIDVAILSDRNVIQKESENKLKYKNLKYRNSANVGHEMLCHPGNHWGHRNCN